MGFAESLAVFIDIGLNPEMAETGHLSDLSGACGGPSLFRGAGPSFSRP
jgi:hypothetical protein